MTLGMVDYRAIVAFLINNIVFVFFFGISAILFMLPDYKNSQASILGILLILLLIALVYRDHVVHDIEVRN